MVQNSYDPRQLQWWATGDTPVRTDSQVAYLIDGRTAMLTMCRRFLRARRYIYLADWGLTASMQMVRGSDHRAGPDGSPAQEALLTELRASGLDEDAIAFWCSHDLTVQSVLGYAVSRGVEVKVLIWKGSPLFSACDVEASCNELNKVGVACLLDDSSFGILHHPAESLHQKCAVIDGDTAFVGGIDLLIETGGKFDRWDTSSHPFSTPLRIDDQGQTPYSWHDVHSLIEGPAAGDVELNFRQRWNYVVTHHHLDNRLLVPAHEPCHPLQSNIVMQIARTIPEHTYNFEPNIIRGIAQLYANAFHNTQRFVYLENQYLWLRAYTGIDIAVLGYDNPEMERNLGELRDALRRGTSMMIILPDHPNVGRAFTDAALQKLRTEAPDAVEEGRLHAFTLATSELQDGKMHYRPIYVHAKVAIVDDVWSTVGSGNLNNRGMSDDVEMNVATLDPWLARHLRLQLQAEHLGLLGDEELFILSRFLGRQYLSSAEQQRATDILKYLEQSLGNPQWAMQMMHERAWANLQRYKDGQSLVGHLLPYLTAEEAVAQGVNFREEVGWIEEEGRGD
jgi:phosphatidylserine/phosphatidylglycerophosphate/cardiolipin synthase-like enzyme